MSYYNSNCAFTARNCGSGCCNLSGNCALSPTLCKYKYTDFYSNTTKYYYNGTVSAMCSSTATKCSSGCCTGSGSCATSMSTCTYPYADFYSNSTKYSFTSYSSNSTTTSSNVGVIIGPVVGGVAVLLIIFGAIMGYRRRQARLQQLQGINQTMNANGTGTTIIMTNNTPQPVYGMSQPMAPYSQPMPINQPYAPAFQPAIQPMGQPMQPLNSQFMN